MDNKNKLVGCVHLRKDEEKLYLGMLSVKPYLQGKGIGTLFLKAGEEWAIKLGCGKIYMQVVSGRKELTDWYERHGFKFTGVTKPFDVDEKYGVPTQSLEFQFMEKRVSGSANLK